MMERADLNNLVFGSGSFKFTEQGINKLYSTLSLEDTVYSTRNQVSDFIWSPNLDDPGKHGNIIDELHGKLYGYVMAILMIPIVASLANYGFNHVMAEQLNNILPVGLGYHWCECPLHLFLRNILGMDGFG